MAEAFISAAGAVAVGLLSLLGVALTNRRANRDMIAKSDRVQAVIDTKIAELTREVRMHNNFARRIPVIEEQIKVANHRIGDLEQEQNRRCLSC